LADIRHNFIEGFLEDFKLAQHAYEEDNKVSCSAFLIWGIESNSRYRNHKDTANATCLTNPISHFRWEIYSIWIRFISKEVTNKEDHCDMVESS
jgi:hypothetical protein